MRLGGRGGGDKSIAQGGGVANDIGDIFKNTAKMI